MSYFCSSLLSLFIVVVKDDTCHFDESKIAAKISNWTKVSTDEGQIKEFLFTQGPLSVALNAEWLQVCEICCIFVFSGVYCYI